MRTLFLTTAVLALTALSAIGAPVVTTLDDEDGNDLSGSISLREAVKHGPTNSVITFDPSLSGKTITLTRGQILVTKSLTIDASTLPNGITIDANGQSRIMEIQPNTTVYLWSLTLTGGKAADFLFPGNVGGAIYANGSGMGKSVNLVLRRCTLTGNSATFGGAIYSNGSSSGIATLNLAACTLTGNSANSFGGGINNDGSSSGNATLSLSACTLSGNSAISGGGILSSGSSGQAKLSLQNTIVVGNTATVGSDLRQVGGSTASTTATGMNLVSSISDSNLGSSPPNITIVTDAKLSPLGHYGGPVQTMHPLTGSPAIDAAGTTDPGGTDARGFPRLVDGDANGSAQFDIGAVEAGPLHAVTSNAAGGANTLREKISLALSSPGARIGFQLGTLPNTITLDGSELDIPATLGLFIDASNLPKGFTISGNNQSRIFNIQPNSTVTLHGLTLTGGRAADIFPANSGGAIRANGSGSGNSVRLTLTACTVSGNSAGRNGGGINIDGGLSGSATLSLSACTLAGNSADVHGGGINNEGLSSGSATLSLTACTIAGNSARSDGGGINSDGRSSGSATLSLTACTVSGNSAYNGGGITCNGRASGSTTLSLTACTLAGNSAASSGGGIYSQGSVSGSATLSLTACTLTGNSADYEGGGIYSDVISNSGQPSGKATLSLHNTLLAANTAPTGPDLGENGATATTAATGSNLMSSTAGSNLGASPANITLTADPKLAPLGDYGGLTQTMHPLHGSPAVLPGTVTRTDQRGFKLTGPPTIGAVMQGEVINVTDEATLRAALAGAANTKGRVIRFASALNGQTIPLTGGQLVVPSASDGLFIDASSLPDGLTIDANGTVTNHRVMEIQPNSTVALRGLTLTGGKGNGFGGAIHANGSGSGNSVRLTLTACTLSGNSAFYGGGIFNDGRVSGSATLSLSSCTVSGNSANFGGGIFSYGDSGSATLSVTACTVSGNSASSFGGGIAIFGESDSATLRLHNTILAANTAPTGPDLVDTRAVVTATGNNLMSSTEGSNLGASPANITLTADPLLAPLGDYGGPTQTMALKPGSPARDAAIPANNPPIATDSRGFPIVGVPDIGAYEAGTIDSFAIWSWETAGSPLAFDDDDENDGAPNGLEYATRRNPNMSDTPLSPTLAPAFSGGRTFEFRYQKNAKDLRYIMHRSSGLTGWTEIYRYDTSTGQITRNGVTSIEDAAKELIILTDPATGPRLFWRLVIEPVP